MLLHRKKSNKRRAALPVSGSSGPLTPINPVNEDGGAAEVHRDEGKALILEESHKNQVNLMRQVLDWVTHERQRQRERATKREAKKAENMRGRSPTQEQAQVLPEVIEAREGSGSPESISSTIGASRESLDRLEQIARAGLAASSSSLRLTGLTGAVPSHQPSRKTLRPKSRPSTSYASDTDVAPNGDVIVPECEVTLGTPEKIGWDRFKEEVLKLTHTLRCKGWRRIALKRFKELEIKRISGALTNAVYMVSPPPPPAGEAADGVPTMISTSTKKPAKLLLRIYGAQVSHLIDRKSELSILRRLARKKIGPRLLGTFQNGRFEEFLHAETLTKDDIRNPETSRQIAKRMRELHEGVDLEEAEVRAGPVVWLNWEKWVGRAREIMKEVETRGAHEGMLVAWKVFEDAVARYREWLVARYGGEEEMKRQLVFAHNDTQYGNILRMIPTGDSPLLLPMNTHRQLVVIDFEYASANLRGFEIANHFCEWMANYHAPVAPHQMQQSRFPTIQEQRNFLRAYIGHSIPYTHHQFLVHGTNSSAIENTPNTPTYTLAQFSLDARTQPSTPRQFVLDARTPAGSSASSYKEEEQFQQDALVNEVEWLMEEARAWRPASHAMWAVWGVVQAKIPMEEGKEGEGHIDERGARTVQDGEEEFNYLGYAQERALMFWGDMVSLGVMKEEEVKCCFGGRDGWEKVKRVE
ncbi:kinase-like protein [Terfezia boudieri ATCC MYA-4762]|uniref:Kinase-like protein n=1 Tax=Terfezia boudieri ATCC MYA-4762 TaxID=1051890 RepID=A0A3N4LJV0_9PEZI|nr:kinase-like protein [Terfezia boudieri ATCC MYA-4762]